MNSQLSYWRGVALLGQLIRLSAAPPRRASTECVRLRGTFVAECLDAAGVPRWREEFPNVVATVGIDALLDAALAGSAYTVTGPYMGLISSVSWAPLSTTISSGTYTTGTGAVSLTTAASHGLLPGDTFTIASAAGTGSFAALNGSFIATTGTTGTTLNFTIVGGLTMTITGGNVTTASATRIADTMASHADWTEAGGANAPTYSGTRKTCAWSAASGGSKSLSAALNFAFTGAGTVEGAFIVYGTGAVSTIDNTAGVLFSAGAFASGARAVLSGDQLNVSYTITG